MGGHYEFFNKLRHDHFAAAWRLFGFGMSGSLRALYSEPIDERDERGNLIGSFGSHDLEFAFGMGRSVGSGLTAGGSAQIIRERIANSAATTYAFGFGAAYEPSRWPGVRLGLGAAGLGPAATYTIDGFKGEPVPLPTSVQGGLSYRWDVTSHLAVRGALEGRMTRGRNGLGMAGVEVTNPSGAALRFGLRLNDEVSSFSVGAGYGVRGLRLDYAYVPLRLELGDTHRFSFATQF